MQYFRTIVDVFGLRALVVVGACAVSAISVSLAAAQRAHIAADVPSEDTVRFKSLDYAITPVLFREMCDLVDMSESQQRAAEVAYGQYWPRAVSLDREIQESMKDAGHDEMRELYDSLIAAKLTASSVEPGVHSEQLEIESKLAELKLQVYRARWRLLQRGDQLVDDFFARCVSDGVLTQEERDSLERHLRRRLILPSASSHGSFLVTVNLYDLLTDELCYGGVLYDASLDESHHVLIEQALVYYDHALDRLLRKRLRELRDRPILGKPIYRPSDPEFHARRKIAAEKANDLWTIQNRFVTDVYNAVFQADPEAASSWRNAVRSRVAPSLYREFRTLTLMDWMQSAPGLGLTSDQLKSIEVIDADFRIRHAELCDSAFESGQEGVLHPSYGRTAMHPLRLKYTEDRLAIHTNGARYINRIMSKLTGEQRAALRSHLRPSSGASLWLGPMIDPPSVTALGIDKEYQDLRQGRFLE